MPCWHEGRRRWPPATPTPPAVVGWTARWSEACPGVISVLSEDDPSPVDEEQPWALAEAPALLLEHDRPASCQAGTGGPA